MNTITSERRFYILYDGRACGGVGTDDASVYVASGDDYEEAIKDATDTFEGVQSALYSYKNIDGKLTDERWEQDFYND